MNERKEPTISAYSPSNEEKRSPSRPAQGGQVKGQSKVRHEPPPSQPVVVKSVLAPFAFLLAIVALGGAGFLYWQLQETQNILRQADLRIVDLESKFELSDDETTASTETIQAKLKWADSEIRKLWGVSHDTNRKAIEANKKGLAQLKKTAETVKGSIKTQTQSLSAELQLISDLVDAQQSSLSAIETNNQNIVRDYQSATDKLKRLETERDDLARRIKSNELAIEAIDAFRKNVNQQLLQLRPGA